MAKEKEIKKPKAEIEEVKEVKLKDPLHIDPPAINVKQD